MDNRFEQLTTGVARIYKCIQKIKKHYMSALGLKGTHVMCIYFLTSHPEGLTASDLCQLCQENKAGISRILSDLEKSHYITYLTTSNSGLKRYRAKAVLTENGRQCAAKIDTLITDAVEKASKHIDQKDREIFYRTLFIIADNLQEICLESEQDCKEV